MLPTTELASRCEALSSPDREVDGLLEINRDPMREIILYNEPGPFPQKSVRGPVYKLVLSGQDLADYISAPAYTGSLDAAIKLAPEGKAWSVLMEEMKRCSAANEEEADFLRRLPAYACAAAMRSKEFLNARYEG